MPLILSVILTLSLIFRASFITVSPPELFGDEIDVGYQAFSLLKTGRDLYGQAMPTYIHSLSEWRLPLLMYATVPSIAVFGLNEFGVRLPEIVFGSLSPIILALLVFETTKSKKISLLSALSLAFIPWHIYYSRAAFEVVFLINFLMLGTLLYLKKKYFLSLLFFVLTFYTYSTAIVFTPLWAVSLLILTKKLPSKVSLVFLIFFLLPFFYHLISGTASQRFGTLSIFKSPEFVDKIVNLRKGDSSPFSSLWHNKVESYSQALLNNYLRAFSSEFLFVKGDPVIRHSIQVVGQLLPVTAPLVLIGIFLMIKHKSWGWLIWLALSPIPSSLTTDGGYHATRLFIMLPPLAVAIGFGLNFFYTLSRKYGPLLLGICFLVILFQFSWAAHYYFIHYPIFGSRGWQVGYKQAFSELPKLESNYDQIYINNTYEPALIRFLFYMKISPALFHQQFTLDQSIPGIAPNYDGFSLGDKYYFGNFNIPNWQEHMDAHSLYLISQRDNVGGDWDWRVSPPSNVRVLKTSTDSTGTPLFYWVTGI